MARTNKKQRLLLAENSPVTSADLTAIQTAAATIATANGSDAATTQALANATKAAFNALVTAIDAA